MPDPTKPGAYDVDAVAAWRAALKEPHFYFELLTQALLTAITVGLVPSSGKWAQLVCGVVQLLKLYGYGQAITWSPPRTAWSNETRVAHGLSPLPVDPTKPIALAVGADPPPPVRAGDDKTKP